MLKEAIRYALSSAVAAVALMLATAASAQDFPNRPVKIIVPSSPGTPTDTIARVMGVEMGKFLGQPVVVENKPGAGMLNGYRFVASAPADGYTLASVFIPSFATLPVVFKEEEMKFHPLKDLPPLIGIAEARLVFGSPSHAPWKTFQEFVAYAKAHPGKLNFGASTAVTRLYVEAVLRDKKLDVIYIPYSEGGPYYQGLIAGDVHIGVLGESIAAGFGDKLRVLAVTGSERSPSHKNVPTLTELGYQELAGAGYSLNARSGIPKEAAAKLQAAAMHALQQPEVRDRFAKLQWTILGQSQQEATKFLADQLRIYSELAKQVGMQPE